VGTCPQNIALWAAAISAVRKSRSLLSLKLPSLFDKPYNSSADVLADVLCCCWQSGGACMTADRACKYHRQIHAPSLQLGLTVKITCFRSPVQFSLTAAVALLSPSVMVRVVPLKG